jgi:hypothetical protein
VLPLETVEGSRVEGLLTGLLCEDGLTILIEVGGEGRRFHTDAPGSVRFIAGGELITEGVICGSVSPVPVTVTYRPGDSEGVPGTPLVVEVR